jgi:hypothetical protein
MSFANRTQQFNKLKMARQLRLLKVQVPATPIVVRESAGPLPSHRTAKQPRPHGSINNHSDILLGAVGQDFLLDVAGQDGIGRLK